MHEHSQPSTSSGDHVEAAPQPLLWWQAGIIYQIYPRSYRDSDGDGVGDVRGIVESVDYLHQTLGIDAIWLSPFYPSPMADFGYDVSDYTDVHPLFGTLADFDNLVAELHARDMKIIIDFVPNHTSSQHPWFVESRSSLDNPKRDWYVWRNPKPDGSPPNNWLSLFGGPAWEWDENTGQYYLHSFLAEQPDLNWRDPGVKASMLAAMRFWLERGVDGFRIDVAHFIMKDPELRDNPPNPGSETTSYKPMGPYDSQLHLYDQGHPDVHGVFREMRELLDEYSATRPRMSVGEIHIFDLPQWAAYYGTRLDELHMPFNFSLLNVPWTAVAVRQAVDAIESALPSGAWPNYVLGNHDEHRIVSRVGPEQARVAMTLLLTLRGTPTIYYGDEIAMHDVDVAPEVRQDPWGKNVPGLGLGRDPERTPMQWTTGPNAGFCPPSARPWLPVGADYRAINVETESRDATSMLSLTRRLIELRRSSPSLVSGTYRPIADAPTGCFVYLRQGENVRHLVALNFSDVEQHVNLPGYRGQIVLSTTLDREGDVDLEPLALRPNEGCVIEV